MTATAQAERRRLPKQLVGNAVPYQEYASRAGRPTIRTQEIVDEILYRMAHGETLQRICRDKRLPDRETVRRWREADPDFAAAVARAREDGTHATADDCIEISDRGDLDPNDRRVRIETRLKLIAQWNRATYGPKYDVKHSGTISLEAWVLESLPEPARVIEGEAKRVEGPKEGEGE